MTDVLNALAALLKGHAGLVAVVGNRIHRKRLPQGTKKPAVVFQLLSNVRGFTLTGPDGLPTAQVIISCLGETDEDADAVRDQVFLALDNVSGLVGGVNVAYSHVVDVNDLPQTDEDCCQVQMDVEIRFCEA